MSFMDKFFRNLSWNSFEKVPQILRGSSANSLRDFKHEIYCQKTKNKIVSSTKQIAIPTAIIFFVFVSQKLKYLQCFGVSSCHLKAKNVIKQIINA